MLTVNFNGEKYQTTKEDWIYKMYNKPGLVLMLKHLVERITTHLYQGTIFGRDATLHWLQKFIAGPQMQRTIQKVVQNRDNPKTGPPPIIKAV